MTTEYRGRAPGDPQGHAARSPTGSHAALRQTMEPGQALELDHDDDDPTRYRGFSHSRCNRTAGARLGGLRRAENARRRKRVM